MTQILEVTQDTVFKRRPLQSTALAVDEVTQIKKGTKLELQSYAYADANGDDFDDHIKFALKNAQDYIKGLTTWYVYELHAHVLQGGKVVYPQDETDSAQTLKIINNTVFKRRPVQVSELAANDMRSIAKGTAFDLQSYAYADADGKEFNDHVKFAFDNPKDYIGGLSTWFVPENDILVLLDGNVVYPHDYPPQSTAQPAASASPPKQPATPASGKSIVLPGYSSPVFLDQPIVPGSSFTWTEATRGGTRLPKTRKVADNMIALATALERPRNQLGKAFNITSWYRPPEINRTTPGAAKNSQHMTGKAIDFQISGVSPRQIQQALSWWPGGMGTYPRGNGGWNHLDIGPQRRWVG